MTRANPYAKRNGWVSIMLHGVDRWRFAAQREDYYDYLSALLQGMRGGRTLKEVFQADASRYGSSSSRGRLSARWLHTFQLAGGDLYATWLNEFPVVELGAIRMAQSFGNTALINTLAELSRVLMLNRKAGRILMETLTVAAVALVVSLLVAALAPWLTVPRLLEAFSAVPPSHFGSLTRALVSFSGFIREWLAFLLVLFAGGWSLLLWSLPNTCGSVRKMLDPYSLWRIYRYVQALRFLALLALVVGRDELGSTQLRTALAMQRDGASPWLSAHIDAMLRRIDAGLTGADTFDTGLLDRAHFWFLSDMVAARGLHQGLALSSERVRAQVLGVVARQAAALRWMILLTCVAFVLGMGLWHYAVIDELRRSLMLFHASQ